ncbi:MAG: hypothetical protein ABIY52_00360 [Gemmatimonadaceae bacterium]
MSLILQFLTTLMAIAGMRASGAPATVADAQRASVAQAALIAASGTASVSPHRVTAN